MYNEGIFIIDDHDHDKDGLPSSYSSHTRYNMATLGDRRPNPPKMMIFRIQIFSHPIFLDIQHNFDVQRFLKHVSGKIEINRRKTTNCI